MVKEGVLSQDQTRNPHYFRHQVIEYAQLRANAGGGKSGKVKSSFWQSREGSDKDINANYFQAEADWMYKAHQDIATAKFLNWLRTSKYNRKGELVEKAKAHNEALMKEKTAGDLNVGQVDTRSARAVETAMMSLRTIIQKRDSDYIATRLDPNMQKAFKALVDTNDNTAALDDAADSALHPLLEKLADSDMAGVNTAAGAGHDQDIRPSGEHEGKPLATTTPIRAI